jgi:prepilin-type processing-associated H-X9-DG protein
VELLVVIGIIAVLISVLLPALQAARRQANAVRCQSQLREIGNALALYSADNKGWWPVVQHRADTTTPSNHKEYRTPTGSRNDYWYMFLLKYFSKRGYVDAAGKRLADFQNTPLWGCPAVDKTNMDVTTSSADFNSGYAMSPYAGYTETRYSGLNSGPSAAWNVNVKGEHWAMIQNDSLQGRYYKQVEWNRPALKGIIGDGRSWYFETRSVANAAAIVDPTVIGPIGYDSGASHQFDKWRHSAKRGKNNQVSFNMLFCDGHVAVITDIVEGFKSMRLKFPL